MRTPNLLTRALLAGALAVGVAATTARTAAPEYDLVLRGGRVVDGSGNPALTVDVAIAGGKIAWVGVLPDGAAAKQEIDVRGGVVAPGFIDVHTHAENITDLPRAENFARMGVTTLVLGNCGGSASSIGELYRGLKANPPSVNVTTLIGHNTVRRDAMGGSFDREPTPDELSKMKAHVEQAMKDGAVGLSTGLIYLPGTFSKTEEIIELAKVASRYGGVYASHMRNEARGIFEALDETFRIGREARLPVEISHIKLSGRSMWGKADEVLARIETARAEGLDLTQDQYVYTASSTSIGTLIPSSAREGGPDRYRARIADPVEKARIIAEMKANLKARGQESYDYAVIASYRTDRSLNGKNIVQAAKLKRGSDSLDDQIELILEIEARGSASGVFHGMSEDDLRVFLRHPNTMAASDSGIRDRDESVPHPRGYGNNARVLGRYVRDLKILRLEDAIRKMTSLPAQQFRLSDRGLLRPGAAADVVVFDPAKVSDPATYDDPHHLAVGFRWVLVNGVPVVKDDAHTGARPGRPVPRGGETP